MPGLGVSYGRGGATTFQQDTQNSDCIVIMGSNMAECHPVGFRWPMKAKAKGATLIHIDPRFTRTSAMADIYVPIRAGTDIVFLGALINYVIQNELYFKEYVLAYTNAATLVSPDYKDTEDLDGLFSGYNPEGRKYDNKTWQYQYESVTLEPAGDSFSEKVKANHKGKPKQDPTLQDPNCVFQILKRHYARYTPEMVEKVCGTPKDLFLKVAETITKNSGREKTTVFCYAVGWTQHTVGVQYIRAAAILQLLLGNIGRPGGGILALRGHATIQGSTDLATLYNILPGYLAQPSALKKHATLEEYILTETPATGWWYHTPKYIISLLKAWYGDAATKENNFAYDYLPKIIGDHSHMPMFVGMREGKVKGFFVFGQNPAVGGQNAEFQRQGLADLDWMVVLDLYETETAAFWKREGVRPADIKTEVFFIPAAAVAEKAGSFTNTQRMVQWHDKAVDPPGEARSDLDFVYDLGKRLKKLYAGSTDPKDRPILDMTWDYGEHEADPYLVMKEVNGYTVADKKPVKSFVELKDDGTTAAGGWIYSGIIPEEGKNLAASRNPDNYVSLGWGFAWPANRRILYNRASADPSGKPWSERKKYIWWDPEADAGGGKKGKWVGYDIPDFPVTKPPDAPAKPDGLGLDAHSGADPFIMKVDGKGWLFAPSGLLDGPLPTHYEPMETPVENPMYKQQVNPVVIRFDLKGNEYIKVGDPSYPIVISTYRLTEHHLSGTMSRWLPWLAELQPELFVEISPELAGEKGIQNGDWVTIMTPRAEIEAKALVTRRLRPFRLGDGKIIHQIGMPWHWGYQGVVKGDVVNNLSALVGDPNVTIHEGKVFTCNIRKGRRQRTANV